MNLSKFKVLGALVVALVATSISKAEFITTTAEFRDNGAVAGVNIDASISFIGSFFNNTVNQSTPNNVTPGPGGDVWSVGAVRMSTFTQFDGNTIDVTFDGDNVNAVIVSKSSTEVIGPGEIRTTVDDAYVAFFRDPDGFNPFDPLSWNATTGTGATLALNTDALLAKYELKPPEDIFQGAGGAGGDSPAANNNVINVNVETPVNQQGDFVFREFDFPDADPNLDYMNITATDQNGDPVGQPVPEPGNILLDEGFHITLSESLEQYDNPDTGAPNLNFVSGGAGTDGFDALNVLFGGLFMNADLFATDFDNSQDGALAAATDFTPLAGPSAGVLAEGTQSGDLNFEFGLVFYPGFQQQNIIPEPGAFVVWGLGLMLALCWRRRAKR